MPKDPNLSGKMILGATAKVLVLGVLEITLVPVPLYC